MMKIFGRQIFVEGKVFEMMKTNIIIEFTYLMKGNQSATPKKS